MNSGNTHSNAQESIQLQALMQETVSLSHRLKVVAESIHRDEGITAGERGVMRDLTLLGPRTVPQLARMRPVSRQHMQSVANGLLERGYARLAPNPEHKRSRLVVLTPKGQETYAAMGRREEALLVDFELPVGAQELAEARKVLQALRRAFASEAWSERIDTMPSAVPAGGEVE